MGKTKNVAFVGTGLFQLAHAASHILPAVQSASIIAANNHANHNHYSCSDGHDHSITESSSGILDYLVAATHHPIAGYFWAVAGIGFIYYGVKDHLNHKRTARHISRQKEYISQLESRVLESGSTLPEREV